MTTTTFTPPAPPTAAALDPAAPVSSAPPVLPAPAAIVPPVAPAASSVPRFAPVDTSPMPILRGAAGNAFGSLGGYFTNFAVDGGELNRADLARLRLENNQPYEKDESMMSRIMSTPGKAIAGFFTGFAKYGILGAAFGCAALLFAAVAAPLLATFGIVAAAGTMLGSVAAAATAGTSLVATTAGVASLFGGVGKGVKSAIGSLANSPTDNKLDKALVIASRIGASNMSPDEKQTALANLAMGNRGLMDSNIGGMGGIAGAVLGIFGAHHAGGGLFSKLAAGVGGGMLGGKAGEHMSNQDKKLYELLGKAAEAGCQKKHKMSMEELGEKMEEAENMRRTARTVTPATISASAPAAPVIDAKEQAAAEALKLFTGKDAKIEGILKGTTFVGDVEVQDPDLQFHNWSKDKQTALIAEYRDAAGKGDKNAAQAANLLEAVANGIMKDAKLAAAMHAGSTKTTAPESTAPDLTQGQKVEQPEPPKPTPSGTSKSDIPLNFGTM